MRKATKIAVLRFPQIAFALGLCILVGCTPPGPAALLEGESLLKKGDWEKAVARLTEATTLMPEHPEAWNFLGLAYHRSGAPQAAAEAYQNALRFNRDLLSARYNLGTLLLENENFEEAENHLKTYEILAEDDQEVWVKIGQAQWGYGNAAQAKISFEKALTANRRQPDAWNTLGLIHLEQNQPKTAYDYFNTAIEQDAQFAPAWLNQGVVAHKHFNDLPLAISKYRRFMFLESKSALVDQLQGLTRQLDELIKPPVVVKEAPPIEPREEEKADEEPVEVAMNQRASATTEETAPQTEAAKSDETPVVEKTEEGPVVSVPEPNRDKPEERTSPAAVTPEDPTPEVAQDDEKTVPEGYRSVSLAKNQTFISPQTSQPVEPATKVNEGIETVETAVSEGEYNFAVAEEVDSPGDNEAAGEWRTVASRRSGMGISVGRSLFQGNESVTDTGENERRQVGIQRVESVPYTYRRPNRPQAGNRVQADPYFLRGNRSFQAGRASEAMLAYREAISRDPGFFEAYYNLGLAAMRAGFAEDALEPYETALALRPDHRNARYNFALALEQGRHVNEAVGELETLLDRYPEDVNAHYTLATLYAKKLGDAASARPHYQRVLDLDADYHHAVSIRYWLSAGE